MYTRRMSRAYGWGTATGGGSTGSALAGSPPDFEPGVEMFCADAVPRFEPRPSAISESAPILPSLFRFSSR